jgi:hypothetical protein
MNSALWLAVGLALAAGDTAPAGNVDAGPRPVEVPGETTDAGPSPDAEDPTVDAGPVGWTLSATVTPDPVPFGGEVELVVEVIRPARMRILVPEDVGASESLPRTRRPPRREARELPDGRVREVLAFSFLALDVKDQKTPPFSLTVGPAATATGAPGPAGVTSNNDGDDDDNDNGDGDDDSEVLEVPALPVRITTEPLPDPTDGGSPDGALVVEAAAGTILYRVDDPRPWALLALLIIIAIVIAAMRAAIAARQVEVPVLQGPPPPPPRPAHEVAVERLDALMPMLASGEVTVFVEKVMDEVLRDYLAGRFALAAGTRTTKEIVTDLLSMAAVGLDIGLIERVGQDADLVKFARASLAAEHAHAMAGRVRALILATASVPTTTTTTATTTSTTSTTTTTASAPSTRGAP